MDFKKTQPTCFTQVRGSAAEKVPIKIDHKTVTIQNSARLRPAATGTGGEDVLFARETALLPRIKIREIKTTIGKSAGKVMMAGRCTIIALLGFCRLTRNLTAICN
jgi:hypothetical protein